MICRRAVKWQLFLLLSLCAMQTAFSVDIETAVHFDNYNGNSPGISFSFAEQLKDHLYVDANLQYKNGGKYTAYCAGRGKYSWISATCGIVYDILDSRISPGILIGCDIQIFRPLSITSKLMSTFSADNLEQLAVLDTVAGLVIHLKNSDTILSYNYRSETADGGTLLYHKGLFSVTAFESGVPFRMNMNTEISYIQDQNDSENFDFTVEVGSKLEYFTARYGSYFINFSAMVLTYSRPDDTVSFAFSTGARFSIQ